MVIVSPLLAVIVALGGGGMILFQGYLVPYTPQFAPRLLSVLPGDLRRHFHTKRPQSSSRLIEDSVDDDTQTGNVIMTELSEAGILTVKNDQLSLDEDFYADVRTAMQRLRDRDADGLAAVGAKILPLAEQVTLATPNGNRWFVVSDGSDNPAAEAWMNRSIIIAEIATAETLAQWAPELDPRVCAAAMKPLRTFFDTCPACDGQIEETTTKPCCGSESVTEILACRDCEQRLCTLSE